MGKVVGPPLTESDQKWILQQKIFFHATAPLSQRHRVNVLLAFFACILPTDLSLPANQSLYEHFKEYLPEGSLCHFGFRCVIVMKVDRVSHSCGYSIPTFEYKAERTTLDDFTAKKGCEGMKEYRQYKNSFSIDGLPSIAQLEAASNLKKENTAPTEIKYEDGYIFVTKYGSNWWSQLMVRGSLFWRFGSFLPSYRDVIYFTAGMLFATSTIYSFPWKQIK